MSARPAAALCLVGLGAYAVLATQMNGGRACSEPGTSCHEGKLGDDCVVLQGDGWAPTGCDNPSALIGASVGYVVGEPRAAVTGGLSNAEIRALWVQHGGSPSTAAMAAAIARAESGGRPGAISPPNFDGSIDRGLFQVNTVHGAKSTTDLATNVTYAVQLSRNGTNWEPWSTFKNGAYRQYLEAS